MTLAPKAVEAVEEAARALESARALFRARLIPECHAYMVVALRALLRLWATKDGTETPSGDTPSGATDEEKALAALERAGYRRMDRLKSALTATAGVATEPGAATPPEGDFEASWAEVERLYRFTRRSVMPPAKRKRARILLASGLGLVVVLAVIVAVRLWIRPRVIASAVLGWEFPASYAMDGLEATEWLLPDRTPGWVDIVFSSSRTVKRVRIFNVHNRYFADRSSEKIRVTAFDDWHALGSAEGRFEKIKSERSVLELNLAAEGVKRLRVEVLSSFSLGGGVAEVEVD
jgi:hypothetical protein